MRASSAAEWRALMQHCIDVDKRVFVQLATLTADGLPSVRTVVFRGWYDADEKLPQLQFVTDTRSEKMQGLQLAQNWAEVCYYSAGTRQQFRLTGPLAVVGHDTESLRLARLRKALWRDLSDNARKKFCWPAPGLQRDKGSDTAFDPAPPSAIEPTDTFAVLLLRPEKVDFYCSKTDNRNIFSAVRDTGEWMAEFVNP